MTGSRTTYRSLLAVIFALVVAIGLPTLVNAQGRGHGRGQDKKADKFINGHAGTGAAPGVTAMMMMISLTMMIAGTGAGVVVTATVMMMISAWVAETEELLIVTA
jgi:hypothetical protein